jgi:SAM-dependent methyltransferase
MTINADKKTVKSFGEEWARFTQSSGKEQDLEGIFLNYFRIFPWEKISNNSLGFDMGCGSGRWAKFVSSRVKLLYCVDPSFEALEVAKKNLKGQKNCIFEHATANEFSIDSETMDFGYCLGVLHHVPDTQSALDYCCQKLKKEAPFLLYLYYDLENRSLLFRWIWKISDLFRKFISNLPFALKKFICDSIALVIYLPIARTSKYIERIGYPVTGIPLSFYRDKSFYIMRTDSLDRMGSRIEKRFSKLEIKKMMEIAGLKDIEFSNSEPYWVALGYKSGKQR